MNEKVKDIELLSALEETYSKIAGLSLQNLYFAKFGKFPNPLLFSRDDDMDNYFDTDKLYQYFLEKTPEDEGLEITTYTTYNLTTAEEQIGFSCIFQKSQICMRVERSISESYILYASDHKDKVGDIINTLKEYYVAPEVEKNNLFSLAQDQTGFHLVKSTVKNVEDFDVHLQYNDDFVDIDDTTKDFLEEEGKSGILIFHGEKGTGKSTYIRHLINLYPEIKFVNISPNLLSILGSPSFTTFLINHLKNTVIILEDCETAIADRRVVRSDNDVALLLNLGDGLMSDDLGIKFICTFNEEIGSIDPALMRKGRLAAEYDFKNLSAEKTKVLLAQVVKDKIADVEDELAAENEQEEKDENRIARLTKKLEKLKAIPEYTASTGLSLADIYNVEDNSFIKEKKQIGF